MSNTSTTTDKREESNLVQHAKRELKLAGLDKKDSDYGGMLYNAVLELVEKFSAQGHSGTSAEIVRHVFMQLTGWEVLTPITDNPEEWRSVSEMFEGEPTWQNLRAPAYFSKDGGKTWKHSTTGQIGTSAKYVPETPEKEEDKKAS